MTKTNEAELEERIKLLAEATGRSEASIRADLEDDGTLNLSNEPGSSPDLISQLKEAAELMAVVNQINTDVGDNKILNGNGNSTEVKVETTLEGDAIDRAIDSAISKAEKIKTLIITLMPIIALFGGATLEGLGVVDVTEWGEDSVWEDDEPYMEVYWGCMDPGAMNYDSSANEDDGSCDYEDHDEQLLDIQNHELSLVGDNELKVEFGLMVEGDFCCDDIELIWEIEVNGYYDDGLRRVTLHSYDEEGYIDLEQYWSDMGEGNYHARIEVRWMNEMWDEETTNGVTIEDPEPDPVEGCTDPDAENYNSEADQDDGSCEYPEPEDCEPKLYSIFAMRENNNTTVKVQYDIDCTNSDVYQNVSVQWLAYENGSTNDPYNWTEASHTIHEEEWDEYTLTLGNFTNGSYDLYFYVIWDDSDGNDYIERKWSNVEMESEENDG